MGVAPQPSSHQSRTYTLLGPDRRPYRSGIPGTLGGNKRGRLYGRLDCPVVLRAIARGGYVKNRVFFADEATAIQAGFRPCAACLPTQYAVWRAGAGHVPRTRPTNTNSEPDYAARAALANRLARSRDEIGQGTVIVPEEWIGTGENQIKKLLERLDTAWVAFRESYACLSDSQLEEPGVMGDWSVPHPAPSSPGKRVAVVASVSIRTVITRSTQRRYGNGGSDG
jgi:Metal binding domain of Ada